MEKENSKENGVFGVINEKKKEPNLQEIRTQILKSNVSIIIYIMGN